MNYPPNTWLRQEIERVEEMLKAHINVPSWWNRRTDDRLRRLEEHCFGEAQYPPLPEPEDEDQVDGG